MALRQGVAELPWSQSWWLSWLGCQLQAIQDPDFPKHVDLFFGCSSDVLRMLFSCEKTQDPWKLFEFVDVEVQDLFENTWQEVELAGSKAVDVDDLDLDGGSDAQRAPFPCSHSSCHEFHQNLHGFCHKHRLRRHSWKLASCCRTAPWPRF